ncbi:unnamed protein product [Rotaria sp. Silwood2]|nr:unnamed protein product [Rotaria sp. Silwood2]CAF3048152.1 unnamed protein product [Rotaria sp. Silwood2]CAF3226749.1 unnamed protein product [Rotaria sp. Silwood2]CAF4053130.1 unnamed protein product [Rotaria sp. Silwood2]CAF4427048.1 unnamed protein product [Rotaria sp. Silwood2]
MIIVNDAGITLSIGPKRFGESVLTINDLPDDLYAILISHNHAIPIGAYESRWMMKAQHVSPDEAVQIHIDVQSKKSIDIH